MQFKRIKRAVDGVLLLDKPLGFSSNQALQKVKNLFQATKAGHTGTLDPLATGLLPLCFGEATKFAQYLTDADKTYIAKIKFGVMTATGDSEGEVLKTKPVKMTQAQVEVVAQQFLGDILQTPPMYSALKHEGKALYEYARAGVKIERVARQVSIKKIYMDYFLDDIAQITVTCSKGTYIRTLAEDIGDALGCGAHLIALRRIQTANYNIKQSISIEALEAMTPTQRDELLLPVDSAIMAFPKVILNQEAAFYLMQGQAVWLPGKIPLSELRLYDERDQFLGVGYLEKDGKIAPKRLLQLKINKTNA